MSAADARGLHRARSSEIGRAEADAVHARRRRRDIGDIVDAFGGFQYGVDQDRLLDRVLCFELSKELVEIMDVPGAIDLWDHDHVELMSDGAYDLDHVVEHPRRVERIDARPQAGCAEI